MGAGSVCLGAGSGAIVTGGAGFVVAGGDTGSGFVVAGGDAGSGFGAIALVPAGGITAVVPGEGLFAGCEVCTGGLLTGTVMDPPGAGVAGTCPIALVPPFSPLPFGLPVGLTPTELDGPLSPP